MNTHIPAGYDAYEYIAHSYHYEADHIPTAKFSYDISPLQVIVKEQPKKFYKFLTTTCAIIGGVFTIFSLIDGVIYSSYKMAQKQDLGK